MDTVLPALARSLTTAAVGAGQLLFYATWIVYAALLPSLAASAGLPAEWVAPILLIDQVLFLLGDPVLAWIGDRALGRWARVAPLLAVATAGSSALFVAMAVFAPLGSVGLLLPLGAWALTSGALRAPIYALFDRHLPASRHPLGLAGATVGVGLAQASAAWIGPALAGVAPLLPFVAVSAGTTLVALALAGAEQALPRAPIPPPEPWGVRRLVALGLLLAAALAFASASQVHLALRASALWSAEVGPKMLPFVLPLFWVAFTGASGVWAVLGRWIGPERLLVVAAAPLAAGLLLAALAPGRWLLGAAEAVAGFGWAGAFVCGLAATAGLAPPQARGLVLAGWFCAGTVATLARMTLKVSGAADAVPASLLDGFAVLMAGLAGALALGAAVAAPRRGPDRLPADLRA